MKIQLQLYSVLRDKLPPEARGRAVLELTEGATLADLLDRLDIRQKIVISVNGVHEPDHNRLLCDGDDVRIFSSVSGG